MSNNAGRQVFMGEVTLAGQLKNRKGQLKAQKVSFVVGAEALNVINVAMTFQAEDGSPVNVRTGAPAYLSSDANGDTIEGSGPDSWAIGTSGIFIANGGDSKISGMLYSEASGAADLSLTHAGADTFYLNVLVDGKIFTSGAITMDATT